MPNLIDSAGQPSPVPAALDPALTTYGSTLVRPGLTASGGEEIQLKELWLALRRRRKLVAVTAGVVLTATMLMTAYQRIFNPQYQGSFSLLISDPISDETVANSTATVALARNTTTTDTTTLIAVLRSPALLEPVAARLGLSAGNIASRLQIESSNPERRFAGGVLTVNITGGNLEKGQVLLNELSKLYLEVALEQRQQRLADGLTFLSKQEPKLEARTAEVQGELASFRERYNLLEPSSEGQALKQRADALSTNVLELQAERARLMKVRQGITNGSLSARGFQEASGGLSVSDADQSLLQQLLKVETELAEARSRYSSSSSMVQGLEARLRQLKPLLRQNQLEAVDAALVLNAGRLSTAQHQEDELTQKFLKQPALIKQYDALQQKLQIAQQNLTSLVSARESFQLEIAQRSVPWRVLSPPSMNPNPVKPSPRRNLTLGLLLGLLSGAAAGLVRDRLDHVYYDAADVKDELDLPLLGHIPFVEAFKNVREDNRFLINELDAPVPMDSDGTKRMRYQRFFSQEAFRNLYTSLRFLSSDRPLKSVALTSSLPSEGKSLVNVLLAKTLSEMGQRILLIDADLRKPQLHHRLGINNLTGLSNLLTNDDLHWSQVIQAMPGHDNWTVISAGIRPPDPTRLLSSQRMHDLVADIIRSGKFDLVLFDTPPVLGLADAPLVAEHCDGLMLLVSLGGVDRSLPREAVQRIRSSGAPLLGIVTNSVRETSQSGSNEYGAPGYGAYSTSASYAYYADQDRPKNDTGLPIRANNRTQRWLRKLRDQKNKILYWLDH